MANGAKTSIAYPVWGDLFAGLLFAAAANLALRWFFSVSEVSWIGGTVDLKSDINSIWQPIAAIISALAGTAVGTFIGKTRLSFTTLTLTIIFTVALGWLTWPPPISDEHWTTHEGAADSEFSNEWDLKFDGRTSFDCAPVKGQAKDIPQCTAFGWRNFRAVRRESAASELPKDRNPCIFFGEVNRGVFKGKYFCHNSSGTDSAFDFHAEITSSSASKGK